MDIKQDFINAENKIAEAFMNLKTWAEGTLLGEDYTTVSKAQNDDLVTEIAKIVMKDDTLYSPCDGIIDKIDLNNNAFEIEMKNGFGLRLKTCKHIADFKTDDVTVLVKDHEEVKEGQPLAKFSKVLEGNSKLFITTPVVLENELKDLPWQVAHVDGTVPVGTNLIEVKKDNK